MSFESSIRNYSLAESLFDEIQENFQQLENENADKSIIDKLRDDIKRLTNILNKINVDELSEKISDDDKDNIEYNINFIYESLDYMEKVLFAEKYRTDLLIPVKKYFKKLSLPSSVYKKWANTESELTKKYVAMLTHPNNIMSFKNQIKRIALGTMSINEFKKIFDTVKSKMMLQSKINFESFKEYKEDVDDET